MFDDPVQGTAEHIVILSVEQGAFQLFRPGTAYKFLNEERSLRQCEHPAEHQRNPDNDYQRGKQFTGNVG